MMIREEGYFIEENNICDVTTLILRVSVTSDKHGTQINCASFRTKSDTAILSVITGNQ